MDSAPRITRRQFAAINLSALLLNPRAVIAESETGEHRPVYLVPNFHPASCGWLTTFSRERVYCANSYLNHLDRVRDDPNYKFVMSEVNNIIAIMNLRPDRMPDLRTGVRQRRVELVNGYFLESTINLSGGEALVRLGVEGSRWYRRMFDVEPRFSWNIDVCGTHEQMPQIAAQLGLEALVYTRKNPTGKTIFWSVAPDGSKILTLCPGHYSEAHPIFNTKTALNDDQLRELDRFFDTRESVTPAHAPLLVLAGADDYALAPELKSYPTQLLRDWDNARLSRKIQFATMSDYLDAIQPGVASGEIAIPTSFAGTAYDFDAFWIENPRVKTLYRRNEQNLQAAESLATIASLAGSYEYPAEDLYHSWILMCLNMDRNTLWGSAGGMVFVDPKSWDVQDRFDWVGSTVSRTLQDAGAALHSRGEHAGFFNPLNWSRDDPVIIDLPANTSLEGIASEPMPGGSTLCRLHLPSTGTAGWKLSPRPSPAAGATELPETIETNHYSATLDRSTGAIISLKLKPGGREIFAAPGNVIVAERPWHMKPHEDPGDFMPPRPDRTRLASSSDQNSKIAARKGPLATTVEISGTFYGGGAIRRTVRFYHDHPRVDFETELNDIPNFTVIVAEFPLAEDVTEIRRGIPFGFSHGAWSRPNPSLPGWTKGIVPAVRWIDYSLARGGGFAIFDRGCTGREINGKTPIVYLLNAEDKYNGYPNPWLSGNGRHTLSYAIVAHESEWPSARVPQMAWEYNNPPVAALNTSALAPNSYVETSQNVIVEALRREGDHIELRLVECLGEQGAASVRFHLPHSAASLTDLMGRHKSDLAPAAEYQLSVRPQQIVTIHLKVARELAVPEPITAWDSFVPPDKLPTLHAYDPNLVGHPPFGS
jgi:alpha-mannosidase